MKSVSIVLYRFQTHGILLLCFYIRELSEETESGSFGTQCGSKETWK